MSAARPGGLAVVLPFRLGGASERPAAERWTIDRWLAAGLAAIAVLLLAAEAVAAPGRPSVLTTLIKWTPLIAQGFVFNVAMSVAAMAIGTGLGLFIGIGQISLARPVRAGTWLITQFFRNAPWLVLLFYCMLLLPFRLRIGGMVIPLPDWLKAILGLSLAVAANMSELTRGAVQSIPTGQWESAESLSFTRLQTLWMIILPQCVKRMLPPWMNLYAILLVSTPLCSIVGVNEVVTLTADALAAENRHDLLVPMYLYILGWFFAVCYPMARWTRALERRYAVSA